MGDQQSQLADYPDYQVLYKWKRKSFFCSSWKRNLPHFFLLIFHIPFFYWHLKYSLRACFMLYSPSAAMETKIDTQTENQKWNRKKKRNSFFILRKLKCSQPTYHLALRNEYLIVRSQGLFILFLTSFFV